MPGPGTTTSFTPVMVGSEASTTWVPAPGDRETADRDVAVPGRERRDQAIAAGGNDHDLGRDLSLRDAVGELALQLGQHVEREAPLRPAIEEVIRPAVRHEGAHEASSLHLVEITGQPGIELQEVRRLQVLERQGRPADAGSTCPSPDSGWAAARGSAQRCGGEEKANRQARTRARDGVETERAKRHVSAGGARTTAAKRVGFLPHASPMEPRSDGQSTPVPHRAPPYSSSVRLSPHVCKTEADVNTALHALRTELA